MTKEIYFIPIKIESVANKKEHWSKSHSRSKNQKFAIRLILRNTLIKPPCHVKLTRIAPRNLDEHDNLRSGLKASVDAIAEVLIPGLAAGRADDAKHGIIWDFSQEKGRTKEYALKIELTKDEGNDEQRRS